jgi:hypothetical protein
MRYALHPALQAHLSIQDARWRANAILAPECLLRFLHGVALRSLEHFSS